MVHLDPISVMLIAAIVLAPFAVRLVIREQDEAQAEKDRQEAARKEAADYERMLAVKYYTPMTLEEKGRWNTMRWN